MVIEFGRVVYCGSVTELGGCFSEGAVRVCAARRQSIVRRYEPMENKAKAYSKSNQKKRNLFASQMAQKNGYDR